MNGQRALVRFLAFLMVSLVALSGLVLGVMGNTVVASWIGTSMGAWPEAIKTLCLRVSGFGVGMACFGFGVVIMSARSLWKNIQQKRELISVPYLKILVASLVAGFGFGTVYFYTFF